MDCMEAVKFTVSRVRGEFRMLVKKARQEGSSLEKVNKFTGCSSHSAECSIGSWKRGACRKVMRTVEDDPSGCFRSLFVIMRDDRGAHRRVYGHMRV